MHELDEGSVVFNSYIVHSTGEICLLSLLHNDISV